MWVLMQMCSSHLSSLTGSPRPKMTVDGHVVIVDQEVATPLFSSWIYYHTEFLQPPHLAYFSVAMSHILLMLGHMLQIGSTHSSALK